MVAPLILHTTIVNSLTMIGTCTCTCISNNLAQWVTCRKIVSSPSSSHDYVIETHQTRQGSTTPPTETAHFVSCPRWDLNPRHCFSRPVLLHVHVHCTIHVNALHLLCNVLMFMCDSYILSNVIDHMTFALE